MANNSTPKCPNCSWHPQEEALWHCLACGMELNLFENLGRCESCDYQHQKVYCPSEEGGCGQSSDLIFWFEDPELGMAKLGFFKG